MIYSIKNLGYEIGTIQTVETYGNITYRAILSFSSKKGDIVSKYFGKLEDARNWINLKYNLVKNTKEDPINFASLLKRDLRESGLSQREISEFIKCHPRSITAWLAGTQYPAAHFLWRICKMLGEQEAPKKLMQYMNLIEGER
tara:strand:+ start:8578 stop:9006 length:429 start_codon:yes stop_codon:yes gene_type:complete